VVVANWVGTTLTVINALSGGSIAAGSSIAGLGITAGTTIASVVTAYGGGTYTLSSTPIYAGTHKYVTLIGTSNFTASWTTVSKVITVQSVAHGVITVGQVLVAPGLVQGTSVVAILSGYGYGGTYMLSTTPIAAGSTAGVNASLTTNVVASWTTSSTTLTVTSIHSGLVAGGQTVFVGGIKSGTTITSILTGGNGLGVYTMSSAQLSGGYGVTVSATLGACSVADAPVTSGYVYPGQHMFVYVFFNS